MKYDLVDYVVIPMFVVVMCATIVVLKKVCGLPLLIAMIVGAPAGYGLVFGFIAVVSKLSSRKKK